MDSSEIVERLKAGIHPEYHGQNTAIRERELLLDAASHIEAQDKLIEELREALEFYSGIHEPGLSRPSEGPWGVNSDDFGARARKALEALSQKDTP